MRPTQASLTPNRSGYRNKLRGLSEEELRRRLRGQPQDRRDTLRRRLALTQNPGVRQQMPDRIEKIRGLVGQEERTPEDQQRLELLRSRRDARLFDRPQASVRPLQIPPDVAPTAPPDQRPTLTAQVGKRPGQDKLRAELVRRRRPRRQQQRQLYGRGGY